MAELDAFMKDDEAVRKGADPVDELDAFMGTVAQQLEEDKLTVLQRDIARVERTLAETTQLLKVSPMHHNS